MTKYLKLLILALTLVSSANTWAVCTNEDLTGFWDYFESGSDYKLDCSLRLDGKKITMHRFGCDSYGNNGGETGNDNVTGTLSVDQYCHVSGTIFFTGNSGRKYETKILKATLNQSRQTIHATALIDQVEYASFTMVKFY